MRDRRLTVARRELSVLRSEKTIVLALLIQLFIAAFSSFLVVGLVSLYDPGGADGYEVDVGVSGEARYELVYAAHSVSGTQPVLFDSETAAQQAFDRRQVDAVLHADRRGGRIHVAATVRDENVRTTVTVTQVRDTLRELERRERAERAGQLSSPPLKLPDAPPTSPYHGFTYTALIPLLLFLPVFISGSLVVDSVTEEFERGTLELLRVAPLSLTDIVDGKSLAAAGLAPAQAALWLAVLSLNGTAVYGAGRLLALVAALAVLAAGLGVVVSLLTAERRTAQLLYSLGVLLAFAGATLSPLSPTNVVARLAIGSADATVTLVVAGYVAVAVVAYGGVRAAVGRFDATSV
ncbi:ABC transporter permease [Haloprofundus halobius]|uniref:ABC transporter permease n=1 Tax=Haloprofundus halobius TaxID=2876194 RepID=UPI001CCA004B|nr:ABC transporter permease [Haloprofundus halobius]